MNPIAPTNLLAGVELGGTKCVCILGTGPDDIRGCERIPTTDPDQTLGRIEAVLDGWREHTSIAAVGLASFGPLDLRRDSPTYGRIKATAKRGWSNTDLVRRLGLRYGIPLGLNTDVNGAALAEGRWGGARGLHNFAYVTVGTGVGVGLIVHGQPVFGFAHSEVGHLRVKRMLGDSWPGSCAFHGDCVEGLASGTAIAARSGLAAEELSADDPIWESVAHALGQLLHSLVLTSAPQRIFVGGGVITARRHLLERVRAQLRLSLNYYITAREIDDLDSYIVSPGLDSLAGPLGALALAADACAAA